MQRYQLVSYRSVAEGIFRLPLQRSNLSLQLGENIVESKHIPIGPLQTTNRSVLSKAVLQNACCLFNHSSMIIRLCVKDLRYLSLPYDDVLVSTDTAITQEFLDVEKPTVGAVDLIV